MQSGIRAEKKAETKSLKAQFTARKTAAIAVIQYAAALLIMLPLCRAELYGVRPFGTALFLALVFLDFPLIPLAALYIACESLAGATVAALLSALVVCGVFALGRFIYCKLKTRRDWVFPVSAACSALGVGVALAFGVSGILHIPLYSALAVLFAYCVRMALRPIIKEGLRYKLLETEVICLAVMGIAASAGLALYAPFGFPIAAFVASYCIFVSAKTGGTGRAVSVALVFGIGHAIAVFNPLPVAAYAFIALAGAGFASAPRVVMPVAGLAGFAVFRFFFFTDLSDAVLWLAAVAGGGLLYICMPAKLLARIKTRLFEPKTPAAVRYLINLNRCETAARLSGAAAVFRSMSEVLAKTDSTLPDYRGSLKNKCCVICERYIECAGKEHERALDEMTEAVLKKGRAHVSDIPEFLTAHCTGLARLVSTASSLAESRQEFLQKRESDNRAKEIVSAQMRGMTDVLGDLSHASARPVSTDSEREKILVEELNYHGLAASEALITDADVALVVRTETYDRTVIERVTSRVLRQKYAVTRLDNTVLAGYCFAGLKPRPRYDMVFGVSAAPKNPGEKSGDTHSFIKIAPDRFMMALCDGMGSGAAAGSVSEKAIGLVESFYRAGFSGELVLKSVNRFLSATGSDSFSALDICVVDLSRGVADIIKLGSPASYLKRAATAERLDGAAAPIGVMETVEPWSATVSLKVGDMVVLATDGVTESFDGDKLTAVVNHTQTANPQALTAAILEHARHNSGGIYRDDSTVIAAKLIETF